MYIFPTMMKLNLYTISVYSFQSDLAVTNMAVLVQHYGQRLHRVIVSENYNSVHMYTVGKPMWIYISYIPRCVHMNQF